MAAEPRAVGPELWRESATALAEAIRTKVVTSEQVIEAHLERIEAVNPHLGAITEVLAGGAREAGRRADRELAGGRLRGPLHGVPFTVKDNIDVAGSPTSHGIVAMRDARPGQDAPAVARLREAGAIPLARTNMPDLGMRWHTDNDLFGPTLNPWDPARSPGGSSGGEAVAIATGMTPLGLGNDYGGSLRLPAFAAGICALRPTFGRVAAAQSLPPEDPTPTLQLMAVEGPLARTVEDLALAMDLLRARDPRDPSWVAAPWEGRRPTEGVRVAVVVDPAGLGVDTDVAAGVRRAAAALSDAGFEVEECEPPAIAAAAELWRSLTAAELRLMFDQLASVLSDGALTYQRQHMASAPVLEISAYINCFAKRHGVARRWSQFQDRYPLVLGPVSTRQMMPVGFDLGGPDNAEALWRAHRLLVTVNLLGLPALAVPVGVSAGGLPQGVQVIGDRYLEPLCLRAGAVIEAAMPRLTPIDPRPTAWRSQARERPEQEISPA